MFKEIWLIRHSETLVSKATLASRGEPEDPVSITPRGFFQIRCFTKYLIKKLDLFEKRFNKKKFLACFTSPLKRCRDFTWFTYRYFRKRKILLFPVPHEINCLNEIRSGFSKKEYVRILNNAKKRKLSIMKLWLGGQNQDKLIEKLEKKAKEINRFISKKLFLKELNLMFSCRMVIATFVWLVRNNKLRRKSIRIDKKDLKQIININNHLAHTSVSKIILKNRKYKLISLGKTPHLRRNLITRVCKI